MPTASPILPGMIEYKASKLAARTPRCRLERVKLDLADVSARRGFLAATAAQSAKILVITEGLLIYLTQDQVASLANALAAEPSIRYWIVDYASPMLLKMLEKKWGKMLKEGNSQFKFATDDARAFFGAHGWDIKEERSTAEDAARLKREMPFAWVFKLMGFFMSKEKKEKYRHIAGYTLLQRKNI